MAINETATGNDSVAITGTASAGERTVGVKGIGDSVGVQGKGKAWHGVEGISDSTIGGFGVYGANTAGGTGVVGESKGWMGVYGKSESTTGGAGVMGEGDPAPGVIGKSTKWIGVYGETAGVENGPAGVWGEHKGAGVGVKAVSKDGAGLAAYSTGNEAIHAETRSPGTAAIAAYNLNPAGTGAAIFAKKEGSQGHAGFFDGNVWVSGSLNVHGIDVVALIQQLQQRIAQLEGPVVSPQVITAQQLAPAQGGAANFVITGMGFQPSATINIYVLSNTSAGANRVVNSDGQGKFNVTFELPCTPGTVLSIKAVNLAQNQTSNTVTVTCT